MDFVSHSSARAILFLVPLLAVLAGCPTGPETRRMGSGGLVAPGGRGPIASIEAISFDEMLLLGRDAMTEDRFHAASLYFGAALTVRPGSQKTLELLAKARFARSRRGAKDVVTDAEISLPPPPGQVLDDVDELIRRLEEQGHLGDPSEESGVFGVDEKPKEGDEGAGEKAMEREERPPDLHPRVPSEEKGDRPKIERPSLTTFIGVPLRMPCKPLRSGRNNLFHTLIHLPPFEAARTLPKKIWEFEIGYDGAVGDLNEGVYGFGLYLRYDDNRYDEGYLKIAHGLTENIEPRLEITVGNLREGFYDIYLTNFFTPYIEHYDRRADLGNLIFGLKTRIYRPFRNEPETGLTADLSLKLPVARNPKNFTTSGMTDVAVQLTGTMDLYRFLHWPRLVPSASVGVTVPFGEIFFDEDVDLDPVFFFGIGTIIQLGDHLALVAQFQGNTSAFGEFDPLSGMVLTSLTGARVLIGHFVIEAGFGHGFTKASSKYMFLLNIGFRFEGQDLVEEILR